MPKASKETASDSMTLEGHEGHFEELDGYTVGFETYTADADIAPLFAGLPTTAANAPTSATRSRGRSRSRLPTAVRRPPSSV